MAKLYLIRRNLETFTGPMTLSEMKDAYKRMQFGLQDEVSGHCGPWVSFDNLAEIKKNYPEIARIVNEDMLAGWGVSDHGTRIVNEDTKRIDTKSTRGIGLALTFLAIALAAFAAAVYMANGAKMSGKAGSDGEPLSTDQIQSYIERGDAAGFEEFMQSRMAELVERTSRPKKPEQQWLPYLRLYAFTHEGQIPGLQPKYLRGTNVQAAPVDCSLKMWRKRWRMSVRNWNELVVQRKFVRAHWARVLAWDPAWIRRRDNKGWLGNQNYYVGCLTMADKALAEMYNDTTLVTSSADWEKIGINKVKQRLVWLLEMTRDGQSGQSAQPAVDNTLSIWTCFEGAKDLAALNRCRDSQSTDQDAWASYNDERYGWNLLRLAANTKGSLSPELVGQLGTYSAKLSKGDHFTRFDYRAELKLMKTLTTVKTPADKAVDKTLQEFPDVRLSH
jgi:hypothetical protein